MEFYQIQNLVEHMLKLRISMLMKIPVEWTAVLMELISSIGTIKVLLAGKM